MDPADTFENDSGDGHVMVGGAAHAISHMQSTITATPETMQICECDVAL